jgi:hypothetical protein
LNDPVFDSIVDIELSENAKATQRQAMFITDLNTATEFGHPVRVAILTTMRRGSVITPSVVVDSVKITSG